MAKAATPVQIYRQIFTPPPRVRFCILSHGSTGSTQLKCIAYSNIPKLVGSENQSCRRVWLRRCFDDHLAASKIFTGLLSVGVAGPARAQQGRGARWARGKLVQTFEGRFQG